MWAGCIFKREIWGLCVEGGSLKTDAVEVLVFLLLPGRGGDPEMCLLHCISGSSRCDFPKRPNKSHCPVHSEIFRFREKCEVCYIHTTITERDPYEGKCLCCYILNINVT